MPASEWTLRSPCATVTVADALVNEPFDPHDEAVNAIIATTSEALRRDLSDLSRRARRHVRFTVDAALLAELLRPDAGACVVTGGPLAGARPFLATARDARAAAVAVVLHGVDGEERREWSYGGLAMLRAMPSEPHFQAALAASRAGLHVWDPDLDAPVATTASSGKALSPRERTALDLTAAGLFNKAIARRLDISPNTVKFHLQAAFDKLGVTTRAEAVMVAIRRGEIAV